MKRSSLEGGKAQTRAHVYDESQGRHLEMLWRAEVPWLWCCVISSAAAQGTAPCVVEVFEIIFISKIKYLLHESAIRASLNQWTQRSLLICLWKPSGVTGGSRDGGRTRLCDSSPVPLSGACPHQPACTPRPWLGGKGLLFFFLHISGQGTKAWHDFDNETLSIPCRDVTQAPFSGGRI